MDRDRARRALDGVREVIEGTDSNTLRFSDPEDAMLAYAHLCGFLVQLLAHSRVSSLDETVVYVERSLDRTDME